jgi:bifunctional NMN adenylyltransferase/nudix hydrolase
MRIYLRINNTNDHREILKTKKMKTIGVIIARFQSPYLHDGHRALVESVKRNHNKTIIVLGVSPVRGGRKNPLDYHTREAMIKKSFPDVMVLPLPDHPLDVKWSQNLDGLLGNAFPGAKFICTEAATVSSITTAANTKW